MTSIDISKVNRKGGTQSRASINLETVSDYAESVKDGASFPPVVLFFDGSQYWLADGFHRYEAYARAKAEEIPADIRQGTQRDAILHSVGANAHHGLRRTNDDKRRAVMVLLNDPEWSKWSDRDIARQCSVDHKTVGKYRSEVTGELPSETSRTYTTKHGTTATMKTANIGGVSKPNQENVSTNKFSEIRESHKGTPPEVSTQSDLDQEVDPETAKLRREVGKLTVEAMIDEIIGLRADLSESKAKISSLKSENTKLKEQLKGFDGDQAETIRRLNKIIEHKSSEMYRANEKFDQANRKAYALEKELKKLRSELENVMIPL